MTSRSRWSLTIDVTLDPRGHVDPRTGVARISGTVTCLATGLTWIYGELRQRAGRVIISGSFRVAEQPTCDGTPRAWVGDITGDNGRFVAGPVTARVQVEGCADAVICLSDVAEGIVRLSRRPATTPPTIAMP